MLPDHVNIILLSATVPNAKEFADWVGCVALTCHSPRLCTHAVNSESDTQSNKEERYLCDIHGQTTSSVGTLHLCRP